MIKQNHQWVPTPGRKNSEPSCLVTDKRGSSPVYWWARKARTGSLFGEMVIWKNHEETEDKEGEGISNHLRPLLPLLADHLSARSLSITWIHWNIINKQAASNKWLLYLVPNCCFFQWVFCLGLTEQMWFLPLISYWEHWRTYWFTAVIVSGRRDFSLWCKDILVELF